ncbi:hypothetical protein OCU04_004063 [Sclerotinia nivalis]|uniref:3-beta hydroxysteroid dehydrogenase/isomerase domain-containing protein n=1 Tax=Sclerotinia nivalis TaxID=352851 RepID=A0A9X0AU47_9HELO|nr:hypothetical protein OCU04_004063 [Sclerotinia nivalis]
MEIRSALVTGGLGFVGSAIVDAIHEKYPSCLTTILDISDDAYDSRKESKLPSKTDYVVCDILHPEDLARVLLHVKPDVVIHTTGIVPSLSERYHRGMEKKVQQINVEGTRNVLNATRDAGIAAEGIVLAANSPTFSTCIPRPSVLMGPGDHQLIPPIHACIAKRETPFIIGSADNLWDITYVTNVADAHILAAENLLSKTPTAAGEIFFIQNNTPSHSEILA